MHENPDLDPVEGTLRAPRLDAQPNEWNTRRRAHEHCETEHHEALGQHRTAYAAILDRKNLQADLIQFIELHRIQAQRELRSDLELEWMSAQELASRAFVAISIGYIPGQTTVADLYHCEPLPEAEAAIRAGVTVASTKYEKPDLFKLSSSDSLKKTKFRN